MPKESGKENLVSYCIEGCGEIQESQNAYLVVIHSCQKVGNDPEQGSFSAVDGSVD